MKGDFLAYFKALADRKNIKWRHVYKHFERFVNGKCTFEEVDVDLCRKFMEYLLGAPQSIHTNQKLHINSAAGYWSAFRAVLHTAYRDRKIKENPNGFLDRIESIPTMREHLSQEELIRLAETPCEEEVLKRAFLFGCLTGLRKSDIKQLTWQQIQPYTNGKMFVTTRMQKTKQIVHNPISDEAYGLLGERCEGLIFDGFKDKMLYTAETVALGGRDNQEDNLSLHTALIRKPARGNGYGHDCHSSLSGTQEHYHHTDLFQDGSAADV